MDTVEQDGHLGRNICKIRELLGLKQDALAFAVGLSQQAVSVIENSPRVDESKIVLFAKAFNISPKALKAFDEKGIMSYLESLNADANAHQEHIKPQHLVERLFETLELNNRLHLEKQALYERLLLNEQEKFRYLESMLVAFQSTTNA